MHEAMAPLPLDLTKVLETLEPRNSQPAEWLQHLTVASDVNLSSWDEHVRLGTSGLCTERRARVRATKRRIGRVQRSGARQYTVGDCHGSLCDAAVFEALVARAAERRMGEFSAHELANTAWVLATAAHSNAAHFAAKPALHVGAKRTRAL